MEYNDLLEQIREDIREMRQDIKHLIEHKGIMVGEAKHRAGIMSVIIGFCSIILSYLIQKIAK